MKFIGTNGTNWGGTVAASVTNIGYCIAQAGTSSGNFAQIVGNYIIDLIETHKIYYTYTGSGGTANSFSIYVTSYEF